MKKKKAGLIIFVCVIVLALLIGYIVSLISQLNDSRANASSYASQLKELQLVEPSQAVQANERFIQAFFDYRNTKDRYTAIRPLMTDRGYKATFPSGFEPPDDDMAVQSSVSGLKVYERSESKSKMEFFNELKVTTKYNKVSSSQTMILRTVVIYVDTMGWMIDDVEIVG